MPKKVREPTSHPWYNPETMQLHMEGVPPPDLYECHTCESLLPLDRFGGPYPGGRYQSECKKCHSQRERRRKIGMTR